MPNLIDSHAHLDLLKDPATALQEAAQNNVSYIVTVGIDLQSSRLAVKSAASDSRVLAAVGIHPNDSTQVTDEDISELARLAGSSKSVVAIGETGLDFYRDHCPRNLQEAAFITHIELARETGLPIIVHSREASEKVMALLDRHATGMNVILHCFSLHDEVEACAERGYFMSIAGNVTFPKATALRMAASKIPPGLLLTETDSPYLSPVPRRGKENSPANIPYILAELAGLRGISSATLADQVYTNFHSAFNLSFPT
ncbi:MAG: TatD family hydrolase [Thermoleophilia bacterium]|nr:TatD family hydrolase [Thermoleophilia bacterium]